MKVDLLYVGQIVMAFNSDEWAKTYRDIGNNNCYWQEAEILALNLSSWGVKFGLPYDLADIRFLKSNTIKKGYYTKFIKQKT